MATLGGKNLEKSFEKIVSKYTDSLQNAINSAANDMNKIGISKVDTAKKMIDAYVESLKDIEVKIPMTIQLQGATGTYNAAKEFFTKKDTGLIDQVSGWDDDRMLSKTMSEKLFKNLGILRYMNGDGTNKGLLDKYVDDRLKYIKSSIDQLFDSDVLKESAYNAIKDSIYNKGKSITQFDGVQFNKDMINAQVNAKRALSNKLSQDVIYDIEDIIESRVAKEVEQYIPQWISTGNGRIKSSINAKVREYRDGKTEGIKTTKKSEMLEQMLSKGLAEGDTDAITRNAELMAENSKLKEENKELKDQINYQQQSLDITLSNHSDETRELREQVQVAKDDAQYYRDEKERIENESGNSKENKKLRDKIIDLREVNSDLEERIEQQNQTIKELSEELSNSTDNQEVQNLKDRIEDQKNTMKELAESLESERDSSSSAFDRLWSTENQRDKMIDIIDPKIYEEEAQSIDELIQRYKILAAINSNAFGDNFTEQYLEDVRNSILNLNPELDKFGDTQRVFSDDIEELRKNFKSPKDYLSEEMYGQGYVDGLENQITDADALLQQTKKELLEFIDMEPKAATSLEELYEIYKKLHQIRKDQFLLDSGELQKSLFLDDGEFHKFDDYVNKMLELNPALKEIQLGSAYEYSKEDFITLPFVKSINFDDQNRGLMTTSDILESISSSLKTISDYISSGNFPEIIETIGSKLKDLSQTIIEINEKVGKTNFLFNISGSNQSDGFIRSQLNEYMNQYNKFFKNSFIDPFQMIAQYLPEYNYSRDELFQAFSPAGIEKIEDPERRIERIVSFFNIISKALKRYDDALATRNEIAKLEYNASIDNGVKREPFKEIKSDDIWKELGKIYRNIKTPKTRSGLEKKIDNNTNTSLIDMFGKPDLSNIEEGLRDISNKIGTLFSSTDIEAEGQTLKTLSDVLSDVIKKIDLKTQAFVEERQTVEGEVQREIDILDVLLGELITLKNAINPLINPDSITDGINQLDKIEQKLSSIAAKSNINVNVNSKTTESGSEDDSSKNKQGSHKDNDVYKYLDRATAKWEKWYKESFSSKGEARDIASSKLSEAINELLDARQAVRDAGGDLKKNNQRIADVNENIGYKKFKDDQKKEIKWQQRQDRAAFDEERAIEAEAIEEGRKQTEKLSLPENSIKAMAEGLLGYLNQYNLSYNNLKKTKSLSVLNDDMSKSLYKKSVSDFESISNYLFNELPLMKDIIEGNWLDENRQAMGDKLYDTIKKMIADIVAKNSASDIKETTDKFKKEEANDAAWKKRQEDTSVREQLYQSSLENEEREKSIAEGKEQARIADLEAHPEKVIADAYIQLLEGYKTASDNFKKTINLRDSVDDVERAIYQKNSEALMSARDSLFDIPLTNDIINNQWLEENRDKIGDDYYNTIIKLFQEVALNNNKISKMQQEKPNYEELNNATSEYEKWLKETYNSIGEAQDAALEELIKAEERLKKARQQVEETGGDLSKNNQEKERIDKSVNFQQIKSNQKKAEQADKEKLVKNKQVQNDTYKNLEEAVRNYIYWNKKFEMSSGEAQESAYEQALKYQELIDKHQKYLDRSNMRDQAKDDSIKQRLSDMEAEIKINKENQKAAEEARSQKETEKNLEKEINESVQKRIKYFKQIQKIQKQINQYGETPELTAEKQEAQQKYNEETKNYSKLTGWKRGEDPAFKAVLDEANMTNTEAKIKQRKKYVDEVENQQQRLRKVLESAKTMKSFEGRKKKYEPMLSDPNLSKNDVDTALNEIGNNAYAKVGDKLSVLKIIQKAEETVRKYDGMPEELKTRYNELINTANQAAESEQVSVGEVKDLAEKLSELDTALNKSGKKTSSFFSEFASRLKGINAQFLAQYFSIQDWIRYLRQAVSVITELDTALTEMRKVSNETLTSLKQYQGLTFDIASEIGTTSVALQNSTADWMRLGESLEDAAESAKTATVLMNVSEFESIDEATTSLVAMSQAYKELSKGEIVDVVNKVGNEFSISTKGLAEALQASAAVLYTQGNDLAEAVALITAGKKLPEYIVIYI